MKMLLPAEDVDARIECRQPFVDKRPALPDNGLEAAAPELPERIRRERRDSAPRGHRRVAPAPGGAGAEISQYVEPNGSAGGNGNGP